MLKPALGCVQCLLGAQPEGVQPTADALKLFRWLLEFTHHASPKVRQRGQQACIDVLRERGASLSSAAAKFIETRLAAARPKDVQPTLLLLNFAKSALPLLQPAHSGAVVQALVRLLGVSHPVLSRHTTDTLLAASAAEGATPLPPAALIGIIDSLLQVAMSRCLAPPPACALACAPAASALAAWRPAPSRPAPSRPAPSRPAPSRPAPSSRYTLTYQAAHTMRTPCAHSPPPLSDSRALTPSL